MSATLRSQLADFTRYCRRHLRGDEKGEAQIFLDRLFTAFGFAEGLKGAGASCEFRIKDEQRRATSFADLVWKPRVLIEMKKAGEKLELHYQQAFSYWQRLVPNRPRYVVLCNFDEFWIYDFDVDIYEPLDRVTLDELADHAEAFGFLLPREERPMFSVNRRDITKDAALQVAGMYHSMLRRRILREDALHFCLQCVVSMFAEDADLLPDLLFSKTVKDSLGGQASAYDAIGGLFREMNTPGVTPAGRFKNTPFFNGGIFDRIQPLELNEYELNCLDDAASFEWQNVNPAIFGAIFEAGMDADQRHILGAHYTYEQDIKKVVGPTITEPWLRRIEAAETLDDYYALLRELRRFRVLDPACGSGNFLFIAFKEMKLLEKNLLTRLRDASTSRDEARRLQEFLLNEPYVSTRQFYGLDVNDYAVELAKVTLMIAKEISVREAFDTHDAPLPLDNLDANIRRADALFTDWPECEAIIGNPPYQSKNKMQQEFGVEYLNRLRAAYPEVNGRADFCVYWFYKAHQHLPEGGYAGLVGTNTIRQNNSRESSLDYIVQNGGTITNAVSSQDWSGEAAVFVSIVNWKKGLEPGPKTLFTESADKTLVAHIVPQITSSLSLQIDLTGARVLACNTAPKRVFQGQTHGHEGFLLEKDAALKMLKTHPEYAEVLRPFLIGDELVASLGSQPGRFVIDFSNHDIISASRFRELFQILEKTVLPFRQEKAELERTGKIAKNGHVNQLNIWWKMWRRREEMLHAIAQIPRYVACARVTQRPIFEFISSEIRPNDKVMVFCFDDDYSFGIIQSYIHWYWFVEKCTTLGQTPNYNSESVWDTFPWPQHPTEPQILAVGRAAKSLRDLRRDYMAKNHLSLRDLYRTLDKPGKNPLRDAHEALDRAVLAAYGWPEVAPGDVGGILQRLLDLNAAVAAVGGGARGPGVPGALRAGLVTEDAVKFLG